jgi:hypothetical protein
MAVAEMMLRAKAPLEDSKLKGWDRIGSPALEKPITGPAEAARRDALAVSSRGGSKLHRPRA